MPQTETTNDVVVTRKTSGEQLGIVFLENTLIVQGVKPGNAADRAGLASYRGFRIVKANKTEVVSKQDLHEVCRGLTEIEMVLRCAFEELTIERSSVKDRLGIEFADNQRLMVILDVCPGGTADKAGLREYHDWLLTHCNERETSNLRALKDIADRNKDLTFRMLPAFVDVTIKREKNEALGMSFDHDPRSELLVSALVPGKVADRHDCSRFVGWRISKCDNEPVT
eukprot:Hpha_TRINITY_DN36111_c0_g1::TRINITY_DN36111_c0_g1_i1::g.36272::m.36272